MSSVIKDEIEVEMTPEQKLAFEGFIDVMVEIYKMTSNKIDYSKLGKHKDQVKDGVSGKNIWSCEKSTHRMHLHNGNTRLLYPQRRMD